MPDIQTMTTFDAQLIQLLRDIFPALSAQGGGEDVAYHLGLLGDNLGLQSVQPIAVGHGGRGEDALLHSHPDADSHVAGVAGGLHLGEGGVDRRHLLGAESACINVLLLELDCDTQFEELPHESKRISCVAGEPRHGFDQDAVNSPRSIIVY